MSNIVSSDRRTENELSIDSMIGAEIRRRRMILRLSQDDVAKGVGVAFQQIHKYEAGKNSIGVSRLVSIARTLRCDPSDLISAIQITATADSTTDMEKTRRLSRKEIRLIANFRAFDIQKQIAVAGLFDAINNA